jgi:hypothetical protein
MTEAAVISLDLRRRQRAGKSFAPDPVIAWWPCRILGCREQCGVTQTAIDTLALFNAEIARRAKRGESLIDTDEVMLCAEHAPMVDYYRRNR